MRSVLHFESLNIAHTYHLSFRRHNSRPFLCCIPSRSILFVCCENSFAVRESPRIEIRMVKTETQSTSYEIGTLLHVAYLVSWISRSMPAILWDQWKLECLLHWSFLAARSFRFTFTSARSKAIHWYLKLWLLQLCESPIYCSYNNMSSNYYRVLESAHIISVTSAVWTMTISSFNDPSLLVVFPIGADLGMVFTSLIGGITEAFFIYRLVKFSKTLAFPVLCGTLSLLTHISGIVIAGGAFKMTSGAEFVATQFKLVTVGLVSDTVCALLITGGLVYHLKKSRRRGLPQTVSAIDRLIVWSLETGLITSLTSAASVICFLTMKYNLISFGIYFVLACIYTNSLLASVYEFSAGDYPDINAKPNHVVINISRAMVRDVEDKVDEEPSGPGFLRGPSPDISRITVDV
ncbi:hypothetical protein BJ138DRAFT_577958 [Hygrophoropsis aurantiaca]|uniref:Uncharacterized protein n=1 Tax=Hygrophoropsis aurantiaca TaxID=72124 RepID=A0ACB8A1G2_9AGAM|nr:hypothetical protein BJ138DRAFT_577958 [Hygrophoropsis aurantiaca]